MESKLNQRPDSPDRKKSIKAGVITVADSLSVKKLSRLRQLPVHAHIVRNFVEDYHET